jgi:hypothetical protein
VEVSDDPVEFCKDRLGYTPLSYMWLFLRDRSHFIANAQARQTGKTFNGMAKLQDITDPLNPISVDGNAALQVTMTDKGEPGKEDTISITVWNKSGGLWFSSSWDGTRTQEQVLSGGNLVVH